MKIERQTKGREKRRVGLVGGSGKEEVEEEDGALALLLSHISYEVQIAAVEAVNGASPSSQSERQRPYNVDDDDDDDDNDNGHEEDFEDNIGGGDEEEEEAAFGELFPPTPLWDSTIAVTSAAKKTTMSPFLTEHLPTLKHQQQQSRGFMDSPGWRGSRRSGAATSSSQHPAVMAAQRRERWAMRVNGCDRSSSLAVGLNLVLGGAAQEKAKTDAREQQKQKKQQTRSEGQPPHVSKAEKASSSVSSSSLPLLVPRPMSVLNSLDEDVLGVCRSLALSLLRDRLFTTPMFLASSSSAAVPQATTQATTTTSTPNTNGLISFRQQEQQRRPHHHQQEQESAAAAAAGHNVRRAEEMACRNAWVEARNWCVANRVEAMASVAMLLGEAFEEGLMKGGVWKKGL
jgi:hypothetical protein